MDLNDSIRQRFYQFYKNKKEMNLVDAFVCFHPAAMCELYMPFNRSIIVIASTRYELGRFEEKRWKKWNMNLRTIATDPKNVLAANNAYDAQYIRYFLGISVPVMPSLCLYTNAKFNPIRKEFLLAPIRALNFEPIFMKQLTESLARSAKRRIKIVRMRDVYKRYNYSDLARHPGIIHVPYQVSTMSIFEQYRMNIPLFFPSLELLTRWHHQYRVLSERSWCNVLYKKSCNGSSIRGIDPDVLDPNDDYDINAIKYWLSFADFYQWPGITYFNSTDDLIEKLSSTNLSQVSASMEQYNESIRKDLLGRWDDILRTVKRYSRKFH